MKMTRLLPFLFAVTAFAALPFMSEAGAAEKSQSPHMAPTMSPTMSPVERKAIEDIVRDYILKNPEVVILSIQTMQARDKQAAQEKAKASLVKFRPDLLNDPASPVGANLKGDVTIVEFYDYRCGYCKRVFPDVMKVLNEDKNIRYVFKEFPILGPESITASKAALAAWNTDKGKYQAFHTAMMNAKGGLPESRVMRIAAETGYDVRALKKAMSDPRVQAQIEKNYAIAQALDINGTPAFIIGDEIIRGAVDIGTLRQLVAKARGS
ncbi:MAG: DsbA family protein [Proteobacteria bacterium]|nr:DsbA family protein [Pseudomonadota bacterium]MDA1022435.1 DsbA family protein [Pseudomonadota bacterium]